MTATFFVVLVSGKVPLEDGKKEGRREVFLGKKGKNG